MATYRKWTKLFFTLIFTFVAFCPIPDTSCISYPLNHQGLLPVGKKVGNSMPPTTNQDSSLSKQKSKKKVLAVSKNLFQKLAKNQAQMEKEADRELAESVFPIANKVNESQRKQIKNPNEFYDTPRRFPESVMKYNASQSVVKKTNKYYKPYYDCPLNENGNLDGNAIIKPDPFDCGCCYYCNWGIHYVQCCTWPLLWNDDIKSCDWYWKVYCYSSDYWKN